MIAIPALNQWVALAFAGSIVALEAPTLIACAIGAILGLNRISKEPILAILTMPSVRIPFAQTTIAGVRVARLGIR